VVKKVHYEVGDMVKVGAALLDIETEGGDDKDSAPAAAAAEEAAAPAAAAAAATPEAAAATGGRSNRRITFATPAVRALAKEHGVDLADVAGTGSAGRVLKDDLLAHVGLGAAPAVAAPVLGPPAAADVVVPVRGIQRMMVKSMNQSLTVPHFKVRDRAAPSARAAAAAAAAASTSMPAPLLCYHYCNTPPPPR
jgi:2-oxoisovalerate dehydrogenase E2 component (dihydrolipoyl transacylase)